MKSGILLLDKPANLSSNQALQKVRRLFEGSKAGHSGTLDPMATGMLPIFLGAATKVIEFAMETEKTYIATVRLGALTDTGDREGKVILEQAVPEFDSLALEAVLAQYRGRISQVPPMFSALKRDGKPLYELARQGIEVERAPREVEIYRLVLSGFSAQELHIEVTCSKGTYIRTLGEDIARGLGTVGHLTALRRQSCAPWMESQLLSLECLTEFSLSERWDQLLPLESVLSNFKVLELDHTQLLQFWQGKSQALQSFGELEGQYVLSYQGELYALLVVAEGEIQSRKWLRVLAP